MHLHNLQLPECTIYTIYIIIVIHKHTYRQSTINNTMYNLQFNIYDL